MMSLLLLANLAFADAEMPIDGLAKCKLGKRTFNVLLASEPGKDKKAGAAGSADLFIEDGKIVFLEKASGDDAEYGFTTPQTGSVCDKTAGYKLNQTDIGVLYQKTIPPGTVTYGLAVYSTKLKKVIGREIDLAQIPTKITWDGKKLVLEPAKTAVTSTTQPALPVEPPVTTETE